MRTSPTPRRRPTAGQQQRSLFAWTLLACVLLCGAMAVPYYLGRIYTSDDLWAYHFPVRSFYAQCLASGDAFDWMPSLYSGFYLSGEGQAGTYHPWHRLLYQFLPLPAAFDLELLLSYPFMLAGTYFFLKRNVRRRDAALLGAMAFTFSGFNLLHFVHPNAIAVVAHIPWLLLAVDVAIRAKGKTQRLAAEAAIALLTGSQLLLGYPQYVWFSLLAEAAYGLFVWRGVRRDAIRRHVCSTAFQRRREANSAAIPRNVEETAIEPVAINLSHAWRTLVRLASFKLVGLMLGAIQLLPTIDALAGSQRQHADVDFVHQGALHPLNALQFIAPYLFQSRVVGGNTHEFGLYIGAMPLLLLAWLLIRWKSLRQRRFAGAALAFGAVALLLALGHYGGLYLLQPYIPLVGEFRIPARYIVLVHLAMAAITAVAFSDLLRVAAHRNRRPQAAGRFKEPSFGPIWRLVAASLALALTAAWAWGPEHVEALPLRLAGPALLAAAAWMLWRAAHGSRVAVIALVLFTAGDLGVYGFSYAVYRNAFDLPTALSTVPDVPWHDAANTDDLANGRIASDLRDPNDNATRSGNQWTLKGWRQVDGYAGLEPARLLDYRKLPALRAAGVRWLPRGDVTENIRGLIARGENWFESPQPLPRARCVTQAIVSRDPSRDICNINLISTALVDQPVSLDGNSLDGDSMAGPAAGRAVLVSDRPGRITIQTETTSRQLLVVSERFHSGWQATLDGRARTVLRANGEFLGCIVEPGSHRIELRFLPDSLFYGKWISIAGLVLLAVYCSLRWTRNRAAPQSNKKQSAPPLDDMVRQ